MQSTFSKEYIANSGWLDVIAKARARECCYYFSEFWKEAESRQQADDQNGVFLFQLLGDVTSMRFQLDKPNEPFGPLSAFQDRRTATVTDFDDEQLSFFASVVQDLLDAELRARLADVLWVRRCDYRMGELAITSYLESARTLEDPTHWPPSVERIERAMQLAAILGRNTQLFTIVVDYIESVLARLVGADHSYFSSRLMRMLLDRRVGDPQRYSAVAEKLSLAAEDKRDWEVAREYWNIKAKWLAALEDSNGERAARLREAECYVKESEGHLQVDAPSYTLASHWLQAAIEAFRQVGNSTNRIQLLHLKLLEYQQHFEI
jgi:hypothetical protein